MPTHDDIYTKMLNLAHLYPFPAWKPFHTSLTGPYPMQLRTTPTGGYHLSGAVVPNFVLYLFEDKAERDNCVANHAEIASGWFPNAAKEANRINHPFVFFQGQPSVPGIVAQALSSYDRCYADAQAATLGTPWACHRLGKPIQANGESFGIRGNPSYGLICNIAPGVELYLYSTQHLRDLEVRSGGIVTVGWPRRSAEIVPDKDFRAPEKIDYMKAVHESCGYTRTGS